MYCNMCKSQFVNIYMRLLCLAAQLLTSIFALNCSEALDMYFGVIILRVPQGLDYSQIIEDEDSPITMNGNETNVTQTPEDKPGQSTANQITQGRLPLSVTNPITSSMKSSSSLVLHFVIFLQSSHSQKFTGSIFLLFPSMYYSSVFLYVKHLRRTEHPLPSVSKLFFVPLRPTFILPQVCIFSNRT